MWDRKEFFMSVNRSYAVFGLGRYGTAVAKELVKSGADVLAVDIDPDTVNAVATDIPVCKCADVTDPEVIKKLDIAHIDVVIIAMAENFEAGVMATMLCKEAGVKNVIVKCADTMHSKILKKVGADKVIFPETESGIRLAKNLLTSGFVDMIELSKNVSMVELDVKKEWVGRSLIELNLRKKYALNVVALCRGGQVMVNIDPTVPLDDNIKLIVIADTAKLSKLKDR